MHNQIPMLNVSLHVLPDFTGRILLYVENGVVKVDRRLLPEEIMGTPALFDQILANADYRVATTVGSSS